MNSEAPEEQPRSDSARQRNQRRLILAEQELRLMSASFRPENCRSGPCIGLAHVFSKQLTKFGPIPSVIGEVGAATRAASTRANEFGIGGPNSLPRRSILLSPLMRLQEHHHHHHPLERSSSLSQDAGPY